MELPFSYESPLRQPIKKPLRQKNKKKKILGRYWKRIFFLLLFFGVAGVLFIIGSVAWLSKDLPNPNKLINRSVPLSTKIYDRSGQHLLYEIHGDQQRTLISISDIPLSLKQATITAEDKGFYTHKGFDIKGIGRALIIDIIRGKKVQGGSTITQQFVKNALLGSQKTFTRKIQELILSYNIERRFTKDEILQLYLNEIPYGSTAYGVQSAARMYFGKNVQDLTLAESALLASLPKAPTYYSPWGSNRDKLFARSKSIIDSMREGGFISEEEAQNAKQERVIFRNQGSLIFAPHFTLYVKRLLEEQYGEKVIETEGLVVRTTLDYDKQQQAERIIEKWGKSNLAYNASNAALVSLDAKTGEILAMVGSKDYFNEEIDGNVNVALQPRQPGSSFKPIVYAAAFMRGYTPSTILFDLETDFNAGGDKPYKPQNYTGKEYGPVTLKKALAGSLNIIAVKLLYLTGLDAVLALAKQLGYTTLNDKNRFGLSLVLGGGEVSLLEHTAAFTVFAQEGKVIRATPLLDVSDGKGKKLFAARSPEGVEVLSPDSARMINNILSDDAARRYIFGANSFLSLSPRPSAIKTGTTNDFRDAWAIGYTPSLVTGVWVGNNNNTTMKKGADGSRLAAPIWKEYMEYALTHTPYESFGQPPIPSLTGKPPLDGVVWQRGESESTSSIHSLLYYIDKKDPLGPIPENPSSDPQFNEWERGVQQWAQEHMEESFSSSSSTQFFSQKEEEENSRNNTLPALSLLSPQENEIIFSEKLSSTIQTSSPVGIRHVEYFFDDILLLKTFQKPYSLSTQLKKSENGFHTLTVKSTDTLGRSTSVSVLINLFLKK